MPGPTLLLPQVKALAMFSAADARDSPPALMLPGTGGLPATPSSLTEGWIRINCPSLENILSNRYTDRQRDRRMNACTDVCMYGWTDRWMYVRKDRQMDVCKEGETDGCMYRWTDRWVDRQRNRLKDKLT